VSDGSIDGGTAKTMNAMAEIDDAEANSAAAEGRKTIAPTELLSRASQYWMGW